MALSSISGTSSSPALGGARSATLAENFQTFLGLLTTQLKNQSPLDPLNTNEFTQQLVQFASVEQQMKSNETLTALLTATKVNTSTAALGYVGATITADGATARLSGGSARWQLQVPRSVSGATLTVTDSTGATVHSETRALAAGEQPFLWNGRMSSGAIAPDGNYNLKIVARDAAGQPVTVRTEVQGIVESVDVTGPEPVLSVGNLTLPVSKVKTIRIARGT
ncbi:MAG TPA: flagellar hook capping FlgD N-terminal domain-containing protein [Beijerinckiaceae bacterium]|nr:flagellar hook capping FlgD N-terminal domain-containing protein [Beijerinckiaceae bacterium]